MGGTIEFPRHRLLVGFRMRGWAKVYYQPSEDALKAGEVPEILLFESPTSDPGSKKNPLVGEVHWDALFNPDHFPAKTKAAQKHLHKEFLYAAYNYLKLDDPSEFVEQFNVQGNEHWRKFVELADRTRRLQRQKVGRRGKQLGYMSESHEFVPQPDEGFEEGDGDENVKASIEGPMGPPSASFTRKRQAERSRGKRRQGKRPRQSKSSSLLSDDGDDDDDADDDDDDDDSETATENTSRSGSTYPATSRSSASNPRQRDPQQSTSPRPWSLAATGHGMNNGGRSGARCASVHTINDDDDDEEHFNMATKASLIDHNNEQRARDFNGTNDEDQALERARTMSLQPEQKRHSQERGNEEYNNEEADEGASQLGENGDGTNEA